MGLVISSIFIYLYGSNNGEEVTEFNEWHYLDPITTYIFSILVLCSTYPISKECYDSDKLQREFMSYPEVKEIHDFHIWQLRPGKILLTAHVFSDSYKEIYVLQELTNVCRKNKIYHSTIQV